MQHDTVVHVYATKLHPFLILFSLCVKTFGSSRNLFLTTRDAVGSSQLKQNNVIHFESLVAGPGQRCDLLAVSRIAAVVLAAAVVFIAAVVLAAAVVFTAAVVLAAAVGLPPLLFLPLLLSLPPLLSWLLLLCLLSLL
jgi:hypothetical protein